MSSSRVVKNKKDKKPFRKGKGDKDKVPQGRTIKASVKAIIAEVVENEKTSVRQAIVKGLRGGPRVAHHYLKLAAEYTDGKPDQTHTFRFDEDELATAKDSLNKKLDDILARVTTPDPPSES